MKLCSAFQGLAICALRKLPPRRIRIKAVSTTRLQTGIEQWAYSSIVPQIPPVLSVSSITIKTKPYSYCWGWRNITTIKTVVL
ncbi:hypothetical protein DH86_00003146 [Scytalidium sp. 3C]|nr:hypothetical protein DH86_00003146 [Scytalidium sp. 3C]